MLVRPLGVVWLRQLDMRLMAVVVAGVVCFIVMYLIFWIVLLLDMFCGLMYHVWFGMSTWHDWVPWVCFYCYYYYHSNYCAGYLTLVQRLTFVHRVYKYQSPKTWREVGKVHKHIYELLCVFVLEKYGVEELMVLIRRKVHAKTEC